MPGIFFKYEFAPVCVTIKQHWIPFGRFLVRICGIIGGVFATSCIVNGLINTFKNLFSPYFSSISISKKVSKNDSSVPILQEQSHNGLNSGPSLLNDVHLTEKT